MRLWIFVFLAFFSVQLYALEIAQLVDLVVANNQTYLKSEASLRASEYNQLNAESASLPQISLNSDHKYIEDSEQDSLYDSSKASVRVDQSLYNPKIDSSSQQAHLQVQIARSDRDQALHTLLKDLAILYFDYTDVKEQLEIVKDEAMTLTTLLASEQEKYNSQISSIVKLNRVKADYFQAQSRLISQQNLLESAKDKLGTFLGAKIVLPLTKEGENLHLTMPKIDEQHWLDAAMQHNKTIRSAQLSIELVEQQIDLAQSSKSPNISTYGSYSWNRNNIAGNENSNNQATIGIELSWLLYDSGASANQTSKFREDYLSAQLELENRKENITNLVRNYWRTLKTQLAIIDANSNSAEAARTAYEASQLAFDTGTTTQTELLNRQNSYFTAERTLRASRYEFMRNYIQLYYNAGLLDRDNFIAVASQWIDTSNPKSQ